jgi:L-ribulose-5-phosphate 3-epimerase
MNTHHTRREFVRRTATLAAGAALAPSLLSAAEPAAKRKLPKAIMWDTIGIKGSVMVKCQAVKAAGFEGVELSSHMNQDEVVKALEATGLKAASVCGSRHWDKPLSDPNPAVRAEGLEALKQTLRDAKRYGATSILLVPGVVNEKVTYQECWQRSIEQINLALVLAEELGVKIGIENVWNGFITKVEQAVGYIDAFANPMVGWHFDTGNIIKFSAPETWIPVLGKRIARMHFKEYGKAKGFGAQLLEGDNNWPAIMKAIDGAGYNSWAITEQPGDQTKDADSMKAFVGKLDKVLAS